PTMRASARRRAAWRTSRCWPLHRDRGSRAGRRRARTAPLRPALRTPRAPRTRSRRRALLPRPATRTLPAYPAVREHGRAPSRAQAQLEAARRAPEQEPVDDARAPGVERHALRAEGIDGLGAHADRRLSDHAAEVDARDDRLHVDLGDDVGDRDLTHETF